MTRPGFCWFLNCRGLPPQHHSTLVDGAGFGVSKSDIHGRPGCVYLLSVFCFCFNRDTVDVSEYVTDIESTLNFFAIDRDENTFCGGTVWKDFGNSQARRFSNHRDPEFGFSGDWRGWLDAISANWSDTVGERKKRLRLLCDRVSVVSHIFSKLLVRFCCVRFDVLEQTRPCQLALCIRPQVVAERQSSKSTIVTTECGFIFRVIRGHEIDVPIRPKEQ